MRLKLRGIAALKISLQILDNWIVHIYLPYNQLRNH